MTDVVQLPASDDALSPTRGVTLPWRWLWWLALPVGTWLGYQLLLRPPDGERLPGLVTASAWGLTMLIVQPVAFGLVLRRLDARDGIGPIGTLWRGLVWIAVFAFAATGTLGLIWHGPGFDGALVGRSLVWWLGQGVCWLGIWLGLRAVRLPAIGSQIAIALLATALATNIFWANHRLQAVESDPDGDMTTAIDRTVWSSGMYGWVGGVLEQHIFRTGRMYINPDGEPLSVIGEHVSSRPDWPTASQAAGLWALVGLLAALTGWLLRLAPRIVGRVRRTERRPADAPPRPGT